MIQIQLLSPQDSKLLSLQTPEQVYFAASVRSGHSVQADQQLDWLNLVRSQKKDCSLPREVLFTWTCSGGTLAKAELQCAEDPGFTVGRLVFPAAKSNRSAYAHSLKTGTVYYWRVAGYDQDGKAAVSPVRTFRTAPEAPRWVRADGVSNVRDCGAWTTKSGKTVKQGLLYRGGEMNLHMNISPDGVRFLDRQLGIRTILDFRNENELGRLGGKGSAMPRHVRWINLPIYAYDGIFEAPGPENCAKALRLLISRVNIPLYFHCWGGADRTGSFAFLIGALLGVEEESLFLDYELTSLSIWGERSRTSDFFLPFKLKLAQFAPRKSLEEQAAAFFKSGGITDGEIETFKSIYLEE